MLFCVWEFTKSITTFDFIFLFSGLFGRGPLSKQTSDKLSLFWQKEKCSKRFREFQDVTNLKTKGFSLLLTFRKLPNVTHIIVWKLFECSSSFKPLYTYCLNIFWAFKCSLGLSSLSLDWFFRLDSYQSWLILNWESIKQCAVELLAGFIWYLVTFQSRINQIMSSRARLDSYQFW